MACRGRLQTDTKDPGVRANAQGAHCDGCEPSPATERAATIQRQIIREGGRINAPKPKRTLAGASEGASVDLAPALPERATSKRKARDSENREREKAYAAAVGGGRPNCVGLAELRSPPRPLQRGAEPFLLYDSGPSEAMIVIFGSPECAWGLGRAQVWGADGTFKTSPRLRAQVYTARAHCSGFAIPFLYALLPNNTAETYAAMWAAIRVNIGQEAADVDRLVAIDFEVAADGAASAALHGVRRACCYFHLVKPVYRRVQKLGLHHKYTAESEFQLRAKMLSSVAYLTIGEVAAGFGLLETLFADDAQAICAYFETNYIGRRVGGARRKPRFGLALRHVRNRTEAGALRTDNPVGAFRDGFPTGVSGGNRPPLWTCVETMRPHRKITDNDIAAVELGAVRPEDQKQALRNQRLWAIVTMYL